MRLSECEEEPLRVQVARLEADLAYFEARLELVRHPATINQLGQRKTFVLLGKMVTEQLTRLRQGEP